MLTVNRSSGRSEPVAAPTTQATPVKQPHFCGADTKSYSQRFLVSFVPREIVEPDIV
jgi:hypothetical protein